MKGKLAFANIRYLFSYFSKIGLQQEQESLNATAQIAPSIRLNDLTIALNSGPSLVFSKYHSS